ncbi:hypothetical protein DPMN_093893 [Dreissena polymorpha]|uniref:Palmitoyltransferase n=1 Tax=Dreissena polymorpha TaxID=45954 RepID=A0A9D4L6E0_DREPO|nr:hypothetical protein DPMN_093893 [Dreissena polymorpha]
MGIINVLFSDKVTRRVKYQAFMNIVCAVYMWTMTLLVTHVSFFHIVPDCYEADNRVVIHRLAIWYIFTGTLGNYITCVFTKTDAKTSERLEKQIKSHGRYCLACEMQVPRRSHHCYLCESCIVKRDHHCFFMGVCIGRENHLYFIFFTLFMGIGTFYGLLLNAKYMHRLYGTQFHGPQTFVKIFFSLFASLLTGQLPSYRYMGLFILMYVSLAGTMISFGFFAWQMLVVLNGQTTYEAKFGVTRYSKGSYLGNLREVFNSRSLVSLLLPMWDLATNTNYCRINSQSE